MVKKATQDSALQDEGSQTSSEAQQTAAPTNTVASTTDNEFDELRQTAQEGASILNNEVATGEIAAGSAKGVSVDELTPDELEQRRKYYAKRAKFQREQGQAELTRDYKNVVVLSTELKIYNPAIGSVATRWLGFIDRSLFVIHKVSARLVAATQMNKLDASIQELISNYTNEAHDELGKAKALYELEKEKFGKDSFEASQWLEPKYNQPIVDLIVNLKHRYSFKLVQGMKDFDEAIRLVTVLNWNGIVDDSQIEQLTSRQKKLAKDVFVLCTRTVSGLYNKSKPKETEQVALPIAA